MPYLNARSDKRGKLIELFRGRFAQCNLLIMKKGTIWGNHYHKKTWEYFYILRGEISVSFLDLTSKKKRKKIFKKGENFSIEPKTLHTVLVLKASHCLVLYSREFEKANPDIYCRK